ncbi:uncharacterized protein [Dermacentor albipictus]|uniref:uncharacterized protein isoform X2 n=1 Tax=Dermacentor albipictus TaxID=60249 RepID=UPI0031FD8648
MTSLFRSVLGSLCIVSALSLGLILLPLLLLSRKIREFFFVTFFWEVITIWSEAFSNSRRCALKPLQSLKSRDSHLRQEGAIRVLEIGAGLGGNFEHITRAIKYTNVDPNVEFGSAFLRKLRKNPKVELEQWIQGYGEDMSELASSHFDVVMFTYLLCSVKNARKVLEEAKRVMVKGSEGTRLSDIRAPINDGVVSSPYPPVELRDDETFYQYIKRCFLEKAGQPALERSGEWLTFADLLRLMESYASGFQSHGVSCGSRVCVNMNNSAEAIAAVYALCCAGAAVVLTRPGLTEREVLYQVEDSGATFILTEKQNVNKIVSIHKSRPFKAMFCVDRVEGFRCIDDFENENHTSFVEPSIEDTRSHVLVYTYTSGTSGLPKGVEISVNAYMASIEICREAEIFYEGDVYLGWNPVTHAAGFVLAASALCSGARVVPSRGGLPAKDFVQTVNKHQVTSIVAFPTAFRKLVFDLDEDAVPTVKRILMCGTSTAEELYQRVLKVFQPKSLRNGYGLSEIVGFACMTAPNTIGLSDAGHPVPSVQYKIVDHVTGLPLGAGEVGEITFRGPHLMRGYHNKPEATAAVLDKDGWFRSGDAGYRDDTGKLHVVERLKDMIKCLDQQLAPAELEALLSQHPLVAEAAVVGIDHPDMGEAPTAFVVAEGRVEEEELKQLVAEQAARHKHLHGGVVFVDHLPKTDTGKIMRRQLRSNYLNTYSKGP